MPGIAPGAFDGNSAIERPLLQLDSGAFPGSLPPDMQSIPVRELIPVLQVAIGPVILISGVGLLLVTLSNRFGRAVDRSRQLGRELREVSDADRPLLAAQVEILYRRARLIRLSIITAALSVLLVAVLIIVLFIAALMKAEAGLAITAIFVACMLSLIVSLSAFIRDIQFSLKALKLELGHHGRPAPAPPRAGGSGQT